MHKTQTDRKDRNKQMNKKYQQQQKYKSKKKKKKVTMGIQRNTDSIQHRLFFPRT